MKGVETECSRTSFHSLYHLYAQTFIHAYLDSGIAFSLTKLIILEVTIASEVLPWVFETKTKYNHLLIPLGQVV